MSRRTGSYRRITQLEPNENDPEALLTPPAFTLSRAPLNTIQNLTENSEKEPPDSSRIKFTDLPPPSKGLANFSTPRTVRGKAQSEPNSAQSTPTKSVVRVCNNGLAGAFTGGRPPQCSSVSRGGSSCSRVSRGICTATGSALVEVPHIDLVENSSFWTDHNVQVWIRIRPISSTERALQGYGRCLRQDSAQTLTWLGNPETRFTFDHVACETVTQEMLFKVAGLPMVENCMSGYNSCMFAYGQTGSGKTYTMMGEIYEEMDNKLSEDCGMTPRIFEYLFTRIREEEENRRDEKLKYSCKCSFLEIYNEQITDLLEPSSTNLQLREDMKKGVYVENLTEYEVRNVKDVIELLFQGAANRKMAATNMNSESSRSHSVFTCVIESRWEKDAMTHLRFGRLNLVDLAGSERQKSSGAEGERLKEAANINKSLSILGLVIMTLVDVAHGKHRHVPYRDSRLTFLLQDSLGGNSKTTIIANVSPSICCANETLSTLKFAQRAKLIQNNAKVNEDASGDVMALQRQIQQLKDQLTFFLRHQNALSFPSSQLSISDHGNYGDSLQEDDPPQDINFSCSLHENTSPHKSKAFNIPRVSSKKIKYLEATLIGSLRREKNAENEVQRLQAQIEHMNRLIFQREDDNQRTRMMLRFQEEKIKRLELLANGLVSGDDYLMEENSALSEEIQLLRARIDRNPELTRFALENIRLLEQLRMFQDFYEHGERETLLAEVSELRDQLLEALTEQSVQVEFPSGTTKVDNTLEELENCKKNLDASLETNARLTRDVADLRNQLSEYVNCKETVFHTVEDSLSRDTATIAEADRYQPFEKPTKPTEAMDWQVDPQVEADVVERVLCIGKQHANIQQEVDLENAVELQDRLCLISQENTRLATSLIDGDEEIVAFTSFVEKLEEDTMNLTSLEDGSDQPETVATFFPERRVWTNGRLDRAVKLLIHKDDIIADLQKRLEEAQKMGLEMMMNLRSLRGATRAITEVQQQENNERFKEIIQLKKLLREKSSIIHELESKIKHRGEQLLETEKPFSVELLTDDSDNCQIKESSQNQGREFTEEKLYAHFTELNGLRGQHTEICQSHSFGNYDNQLEGAHSEKKIELAMLEMGQMLQTFEQRMEEAEAGFHKAREMLCLKLSDARLVAAEKSNQANTLLLKFEEAQETIEEADLVLNALLKANENAKHETDMWKQAGQELMAEKGVLIEEVQRLKASVSLTEQQCEITDSISSLEESLVQIHRDLEETFKLVYCHNFSFGRELHDFIDTVRSLLEDIWSDMIEKHFALFVVQQCYLGFFLDKVTESIPYKFQVRSLEVVMDHTNLISENLLLKKELVRKDVLLKGLLFDFRLLQESASDAKDIKDETEEMLAFLRQVQHELAIKTSQLDDISVQHRMLEAEFSDAKAALLVSRSELEQAKGTLELVSKENIDLKVLLDDLHYRSAVAEQQLEEKQKVVEDLEKEIFRLDSSVEKKILSSTEVIDNALRRVSNERDRLRAKVVSLKDQLEMAQALADENEAIAVEARQVSEASKIYAEQKEEEAKILERSVEELECTINVLEKKVYEMGEEVDRQCLMREDLELELQALRPRMLTIQNATGSLETDSLNVGEEDEDQIPRYEEEREIQILEKEILDQAEKIKQYEEYISELVLHAEAQTSQYHQKYTALEAMIHEAKAEPSSNPSISTVNKTEKTSTRIRGSGSPFKCIAGLVQQMNSEKDQELSLARLRIDELEALAASRQKEVCMLSARLAAAESMTHDVIRDLLGVKLDMTNYANLIDQQQVQKLAEKAQQFSEESHAKELEILKLREQINDFIDERESLIGEINQRQTDTLAAQVAVEQLQQRDQMLAAQNGMLKMDKENLKRKVVELDEMVKKLSRSRNFQQRIHQDTKIREGTSSRSRNDEIMKRLAHSAKLLSRVNEVHSRFHKCDGGDPDLDSDEEQG